MNELINKLNATVLKAILELGPGKATGEYLALVCDTGVASVYRSLERLVAGDIVGKTGNTYSVNATNPFVQRFSELVDAESLINMDQRLYSEAVEVNQELGRRLKASGYALAIFGSSAAGTSSAESDVDMLLVVEKASSKTVPIETISQLSQITVMTKRDFAERWRRGNDVVRSAVSFGIILHDPWHMFYDYRASMPRPGITTSATIDARKDTSKMFDRFYESAGPEVANWTLAQSLGARLATQIGRLLLMEAGIAPRTRPEVAEQLRRVGFTKWKDVLRAKEQGAPGKSNIDKMTKSVSGLYDYYTKLTEDPDLWHGLYSLLWGRESEIADSLCHIFDSLGIATERKYGRGATKIDIVIRDEEDRPVGIEVKTSTRGIDARVGANMLDRMPEDSCVLIYNPYREYPPDVRSYDVNPRVRRRAENAGIMMVPSNTLFGALSDFISEGRPVTSGELLAAIRQAALNDSVVP
jgi:predicted nucleotidyltransferase